MLNRWGICRPRGAFWLVDIVRVAHAPTGESGKNSDVEIEEIIG